MPLEITLCVESHLPPSLQKLSLLPAWNWLFSKTPQDWLQIHSMLVTITPCHSWAWCSLLRVFVALHGGSQHDLLAFTISWSPITVGRHYQQKVDNQAGNFECLYRKNAQLPNGQVVPHDSYFLNFTEILYVCMRLYVFRYMHTYMLKCVWRPREHFGYHPKEHHLPPLTHSLSCCWSSPIRVDPSGHRTPVFVSPVCGCTCFLHGTGDLIQVLYLQGKLLYQLRQRHILMPIVNILGTVQRIIQPLSMEFVIQKVSNNTRIKGKWSGGNYEVSHHLKQHFHQGMTGNNGSGGGTWDWTSVSCIHFKGITFQEAKYLSWMHVSSP